MIKLEKAFQVNNNPKTGDENRKPMKRLRETDSGTYQNFSSRNKGNIKSAKDSLNSPLPPLLFPLPQMYPHWRKVSVVYKYRSGMLRKQTRKIQSLYLTNEIIASVGVKYWTYVRNNGMLPSWITVLVPILFAAPTFHMDRRSSTNPSRGKISDETPKKDP